ncbi:MAG: hypothetical protein COB66_06775 [Coxiella sp. (in: Bacteria)]|nr:MAG: hypothetical protein COB66_06775 [Coxiella sp. (in: g-proteobacteria)]
MKKMKNARVLQLTDLHLFKSDSDKMFGVTTNDHFFKVIERVKKNLTPLPDMILLTGDLSQDGTAASYDIIANTIDPLGIPAYFIPGNHDNFDTMRTVFEKTNNIRYVDYTDLLTWRFIFLNTQKIGATPGLLAEGELKKLKQCLNAPSSAAKHIVIVMHHHPMKVGTPHMDQYILKNNAAFFKILAPFNNVKLILTGHVHNHYSLMHGNIAIMSAPATSVQLKKGAVSVQPVDEIGYSLFTFNTDDYAMDVCQWNSDAI